MKVKEIKLPDGWGVDKIENGKIILKEIENPIDKLPNNWTEYLYKSNIRRATYSCNVLYEAEEYGAATQAFSKLIRLRDCYRMGWKPSTDTKFIMNTPTIFHQKNIGMVAGHSVIGTDVFSFQSEEIRDKFYNNFKDLLKQIKPLYE